MDGAIKRTNPKRGEIADGLKEHGFTVSGWLGAINYGVIVANDVDAYVRG